MQPRRLKPCEQVQAASRYLDPTNPATETSVCKRFNITSEQLKTFSVNLVEGNFKEQPKHWNPAWSREGIIHHPVDSYVFVDIKNGGDKSADSDLLFDPDFDSINGVLHIEWTNEQIFTLLENIPYRVVEIIRDISPKHPLYQEAMLLAESDFFKLICKFFNLDSDLLIAKAIELKALNSQ